MNETYIAGVSVLSAAAQDEAGLLALAGKALVGTAETGADFSAPLAFTPKAKHPTLRRAPRLSRMAAEVADMVGREADADASDAEATGTIWVSGYGENTIFAKLSETRRDVPVLTSTVPTPVNRTDVRRIGSRVAL